MKNLITRVAVASAVAALFAACQHGDPVSNAGTPSGSASLVSAAPKSVLPGGSANVTTVFAGFDPSVKDAFSRMPSDGVHGPFWDKGNQYWRYRQETYRNGEAGRQDPRYPFISASSTAEFDFNDFGAWDLYTPGIEGDSYWETYSYLDNLQPNTTYTVAFVNYALKPAGQLDQTQMMLTGAVTQPDSLVIVSGTRGEIALGAANSNWTGAAPAGCGTYPHVNTNPFIVVQEPSDANGVLGFDKCWTSENGLGGLDDYSEQRKSMVGTQNDQSFALPNYNYIEVWQGDYGTGTLVMRIQIAQDLTPSGKPINNTYPPFPAPNMSSSRLKLADLSPFPLPDSVLAQLNGAKGAPTGMTLTLTNLQALDKGNAAYVVWYVNPTTGTVKKAVGDYSRTVGGNQAESATGVSAFKGGPGTITFTTTSTVADMGNNNYADSLVDVVISQESDPSVAAPTASKVLWASVFKLPPVNAGGALTFGNFPTLAFTPQGVATGGVLGDTSTTLVTENVGGKPTQVRETQFNGSKLAMQFTGLQRPPVGYKYEMFLRTEVDSAAGRDNPTLVDVGGLFGPDGASLDNAATAPTSSNLSATGIVSAQTTIDLHSRTLNGKPDQLCNYDAIRLYLVPMNATSASVPEALIFDIPMPAKVMKAATCS